MKKSLMTALFAGAAIAAMGGASVQAATLDSVAGPILFKFTGFDAAQVGYTRDCSGATVAAGVADCDLASAPTPAAPGASGTDDTWGITRVSSIVDTSVPLGPTLWNDGDDGDVLFTYFHSFQDFKVAGVGGGITEIFSTGGTVDIYRVDGATVAGLDLTDQTTLAADLVPLAGSLYLSLDFKPGCDLIETQATLCGDFDLTTLTGNSSGIAQATAGAALTKYPNDFFFTQDVEECPSGAVGCTPSTSFNIFVRGGEANTIALPEPGALGLLGLGLVGLGLAGRRRKA